MKDLPTCQDHGHCALNNRHIDSLKVESNLTRNRAYQNKLKLDDSQSFLTVIHFRLPLSLEKPNFRRKRTTSPNDKTI
jgi:hypothetical protein